MYASNCPAFALCSDALEPPTNEAPKRAIRSLTDEWVLERLLNKGGQAEVWLGRNKAHQAVTTAVKLIPNGTDARRELDAYRRVHAAAPHPHIINFVFSFSDQYACTRALHSNPFMRPTRVQVVHTPGIAMLTSTPLGVCALCVVGAASTSISASAYARWTW